MTANKILFDAHQSLAANMLLFGVHEHQESDHERTRDSMTYLVHMKVWLLT